MVSEFAGYSVRSEHRAKAPSAEEVREALSVRGFNPLREADGDISSPQSNGLLTEYLAYRARVLNEYVRPRLMNVDQAAAVFARLHGNLNPTCPIPMNKQTGDKKARAFFTGIVNMLVEAHGAGIECDYNPQRLITASQNGELVFTSARRMDGAFGGVKNPIAVLGG